MSDEKRYFKLPARSEFISANLPRVIFIITLIFLSIPSYRFVKWCIRSSQPFVLFADCVDIVIYCVFVSVFLVWEFKNVQNLYYRMKEVPFLTITKEGIVIDRELLSFPKWVQRKKVRIEWSNIRRAEVVRDRLSFLYQVDGKEKSEKGDLRWIKGKESLLSTLKIECEKNQISLISRDM